MKIAKYKISICVSKPQISLVGGYIAIEIETSHYQIQKNF